MIHVVFEKANVEALRKSFELDPSMDGEIAEVQDDFAVGPLADVDTEEGAAARLQWWKDILAGGHNEGLADDGHVDDQKVVRELKAKLDENPEEIVWIWAAQNKHDVSGYYWLMSQLTEYQGRIYILYLNNLPFINEKGNIFYPTNLFQIQPKEFVKAKKLARVITPSEFEVDPDEWTKLCNEDKGVRQLEGGKKLVSRGYDYYDNELLKFVTKEWQKGNKLLQQYFSKSKEITGDSYLLWRLKYLVEVGKIEMQGDWRNMKDFQVRLPGTNAEAAETTSAEASQS
ncbi:DUF1835 domain-containing protein [Aridibaculum aurantiacum]|uniref:DUF1835 domain-containing protein n=1 Tax=Aridibaculum aurantiacum TaxID=2810307 RepID=UPI001A95F1A7|nr:DUF1835 domain-containing protein [Aridibaculum aurantiacum]